MNKSSNHVHLATLPMSFPDGPAVVDGGPNWPAEVTRALHAGATGAVVVHPQPADVGELLETTAGVVVDSIWASNPAVPGAAQAFRAAATDQTRLECRAVHEPGTDFTAALLNDLALVRALLSPVRDVLVHHRSSSALVAEGITESGVTVDFAIVCTSALPSSATVRLLTTDGSVELVIPAADTARPAQSDCCQSRWRHGGADTVRVLAPSRLRRLRDLLASEQSTPSIELRELHADISVATAALRADRASA